MKVTAVATRTGEWWAIQVPEVPGVFTQAKRLEQVPDTVADAVATMLEVPADSVDVEVRPVLGQGLEDLVRGAREAVAEATTAQERASTQMRLAVSTLRVRLTTRDVAAVLGVTHQRVSQLDKSAR
ncbi:type II toxin-antitoxin system HicB family antitoxin [Occultella aeris]|uniref:Antitoxin HicB n=1 Tax=Occultella aeris TaxID=2761496 RepID=A0A7M4DGL6_9MICO|nr:hypothetical protein [Occultella aeris]VZO36059.1 hypothetical protein HALOF300_01263 [Occultella aeris]